MKVHNYLVKFGFSKYECSICKKEFRNGNSLSFHRSKHDMVSKPAVMANCVEIEKASANENQTELLEVNGSIDQDQTTPRGVDCDDAKQTVISIISNIIIIEINHNKIILLPSLILTLHKSIRLNFRTVQTERN